MNFDSYFDPPEQDERDYCLFCSEGFDPWEEDEETGELVCKECGKSDEWCEEHHCKEIEGGFCNLRFNTPDPEPPDLPFDDIEYVLSEAVMAADYRERGWMDKDGNLTDRFFQVADRDYSMSRGK